MSKPVKHICIPVINDLATDQRVLRIARYWHNKGYRVHLYGRVLKNSLPMPDLPFDYTRRKHFFHSGPFFYAEYSIRLFFFLCRHASGLIWANDLDTLPASALVRFLKKNIRLIYDAHEYFTEVPELQRNPFAKKVWTLFEKICLPKADYFFTVNQSIADVYTKKYKKPFHVLRNMPYRLVKTDLPELEKLGLPADKKRIILQGSGINVDRGAEEAVEAMALLSDAYTLIIAGSGDVLPILKRKVKALGMEQKVLFFDRMPYLQLMEYTRSCDLGLSLDKDTNLNYRLALPNKIFDYIQAEIPVLVSDLPELSRIVDGFEVGVKIKDLNPNALAEAIEFVFENEERYKQWKNNTAYAAEILCRENEEKVLDILPL